MTSKRRWGRLAVAGTVVLALSLSAAAQQSAGPQPQPQAAPPSDYRPGFLEALGRWFSDPVSSMSSGVRGAQSTLDGVGTKATDVAKGAAGVAKDTADTVARIPATRVVSGRERCTPAPNGAPDCSNAAHAVCRSNGLSSGRSVDIQSAEDCPARVWISGRQNPGDCKTETYVTRAICQ